MRTEIQKLQVLFPTSARLSNTGQCRTHHRPEAEVTYDLDVKRRTADIVKDISTEHLDFKFKISSKICDGISPQDTRRGCVPPSDRSTS
jgi:hypothetical protein